MRDLAARLGLLTLLLGLLAGVPGAARAFTCTPRGVPWRIDSALPHVAARLAAGAPVTIVAIGSSSTYGAGASSMAANYPSRLAAELASHWPGRAVRVVNRGISGELASETLRRFPRDMAAERPDLVVWQVGTNDLTRGISPAALAEIIRDGLRQIRDARADALLMDAQYAPAVLAKPGHAAAVALVERIGREQDVPVFRRFATMRTWIEAQHARFGDVLIADGLHMNDEGYACLGRLLADAIAEGAEDASPAGPVLARPVRTDPVRTGPVQAAASTAPSPRMPPQP